MDMVLLDNHMIEREHESELTFPPKFLEERPCYDIFHEAPKFVTVPEGLHCHPCYNYHGYPSRELSEDEALNFLLLLARCPNCNGAHIEYPRRYIRGQYDYMNEHFSMLDRKFDSIEALMRTCCNRHINNEKSWKLVREVDTRKDDATMGRVLESIMELPEGILEDCKVSFRRFLKKLYRDRTGFVKGKYLVISTELLYRQCEGDKVMFLKALSEAYSLVESQYFSITRLAIEGGFWQVCPELGGFFWRNNNLETEFPCLRKFLQGKKVFVKNFSLSMGPYYMIGGGYFSYIKNMREDVVVWYIPNFWQEGFSHEKKACYYNEENFWYGWYTNKKSSYGSRYNGVTAYECDSDMLDFFGIAVSDYYN